MIGDPSAQEEKGHQGLQGVVRGKDGHSSGAGVKEQVRIRRLKVVARDWNFRFLMQHSPG